MTQSATRTEHAALVAAFSEIPRVQPVDMATTDRIADECRAYLATLSPERRAKLNAEWTA
jgi:hypothetical protein